MSTLDPFKADGYSLIRLTDMINKLPHKPMRLTDMGLFVEEGIDTLTVAIEEKSGSLELVPNVPRGADGLIVVDDKRVLNNLSIAHLPQQGAVMADEVQGIRTFGSENETDLIDAKVTRELQRMKDKLDVTIEWMKIAALQGIILQISKAGVVSTLYNLFTVLNVIQQTHAFDFSDADLEVNEECRKVIRQIEDDLGAFSYQRIHCFCGADFLDELLKHPSAKQFVVNWSAASQFLQDDLRFAAVKIGNVIFEEYRGRVNGTDYIEADEAWFFPIGVTDMFKSYFGPANYIETVNTIGLPYYAKQATMKFDKGIEFESQSNPLPINKRPRAVVKGTMTPST